jgi:hypothetical protein
MAEVEINYPEVFEDMFDYQNDNEEEIPQEDENYDPDLEDDEEIATGKLSPSKLEIQYKLKPLEPTNNIFKDEAENPDIFETRLGIVKAIKESNIKDVFGDKMTLAMYSRIFNNKFWYGMSYPPEIESIFKLLF